MPASSSLLTAGLACAAASIVSWLAIAALRPWLRRVAGARPDARSSHKDVTPQGAGIGVVASIILVAGMAAILAGAAEVRLLALLAAVAGLTVLGFIDDVRPIAWAPKLAVQAVAAVLATLSLPADATLVPPALFWAERAVAALVLLTTINIVNFIDGIDEITLAHAAPAFAMIWAAALLMPMGGATSVIAAAGLGAMAGFWPWNRHPASIFLGDSGSLPLGLLLGWLALNLALQGQPAAALLVLLYPLVDGGLTLLRRFLAGRRLTEPHRDHAYQRAVDNGLRAPRVALTVALVSILCGGLALVSIRAEGAWAAAAMLTIGTAVVLLPVIAWLQRPRRSP
ncbi:MAG: glycosyl transferase [Phreatobacter sp.]|uniref:glycosyl transferase n=1 Tax=Phreatobacter sp. TaxID=1966341 RepID=UPI002735AECD|nr:glycosyl transferase [Phreatobacter sp.]MDP2801192.1 glycosyl transferase [Phreatobacter sp.]